MYVLRPERIICINEVECVLCKVRVQAEERVKFRASSMIDFKCCLLTFWDADCQRPRLGCLDDSRC